MIKYYVSRKLSYNQQHKDYERPITAVPLEKYNGDAIVLLTGKEIIKSTDCGDDDINTEFSLVLPNLRMFPMRVLIYGNKLPGLSDDIIQARTMDGDYIYAELERAVWIYDGIKEDLSQIHPYSLMIAKSIKLI